jgi:hypothetical protein
MSIHATLMFSNFYLWTYKRKATTFHYAYHNHFMKKKLSASFVLGLFNVTMNKII